MKQTKRKIKVKHPGLIFRDNGKEEPLELPEDKEVILEEEHDGQDDKANV